MHTLCHVMRLISVPSGAKMYTHTNTFHVSVYIHLSCKGQASKHTRPYIRPCIHVHARVMLPALFLCYFVECALRNAVSADSESSASPHRIRIQLKTNIQTASEYSHSLKSLPLNWRKSNTWIAYIHMLDWIAYLHMLCTTISLASDCIFTYAVHVTSG